LPRADYRGLLTAAAYRGLIGSGDGPISVSPFPPWRSRGWLERDQLGLVCPDLT